MAEMFQDTLSQVADVVGACFPTLVGALGILVVG